MKTFNELFEQLRKLSKNGVVDASTATEYMKKGRFNYAYCVKKHGINQSQADFNLAVKGHFGTLNPQIEEAESQITKEQFLATYEFGKYPRVREWVSHVKQETGLYVSLQDIFKWILESK